MNEIDIFLEEYLCPVVENNRDDVASIDVHSLLQVYIDDCHPLTPISIADIETNTKSRLRQHLDRKIKTGPKHSTLSDTHDLLRDSQPEIKKSSTPEPDKFAGHPAMESIK